MTATAVCLPVLNTAQIRYSVQPGLGFLADGYYKARKMCHSGTDYNATTGGDTDLGDPVYCIADGVVESVGPYRGWGITIVIHHAQLGVWSMYSHLQDERVAVGQAVRMGERIGSIGKGDKGQFFAHLHFEIRKVALAPWLWPSSQITDRRACEAFIRERYHDAEVWLKEHGALTMLAQVQAHYAKPEQPLAPPPGKVPANWEQVHDAQNMRPIPGDWVSIVTNTQTGEVRLVRVPEYKLKERGLV